MVEGRSPIPGSDVILSGESITLKDLYVALTLRVPPGAPRILVIFRGQLLRVAFLPYKEWKKIIMA